MSLEAELVDELALLYLEQCCSCDNSGRLKVGRHINKEIYDMNEVLKDEVHNLHTRHWMNERYLGQLLEWFQCLRDEYNKYWKDTACAEVTSGMPEALTLKECERKGVSTCEF